MTREPGVGSTPSAHSDNLHGDNLHGDNLVRLHRLVRRLPYEQQIAAAPAGVRRHRAERRLRHLLTLATTRSPWWRQQLAGVDPAKVTVGDLSSLPILTRKDLIEHGAGMVVGALPDPLRLNEPGCDTRTEPGCHMGNEPGCHMGTEPGCHMGTEPGCHMGGMAPQYGFDPALDCRGRSLHLVRSSGTTGVPVTVVWSEAGWLRMALTAMRSAAPPGGLVAPAPATVLAAFGGGPDQMSGLVAASFSTSVLRIVALPATIAASDLLELVEEVQPVEVRGYPSVLRRLAVETLARGTSWIPPSVSVSGELLTPATAALITAAFGRRPANSWGTTETGWIGFSGSDPLRMTLADDACIVENVDRDLRPVPSGVAGDAVLLTSLVNTALPLLRYRVDDSVVLEPDGDHCTVTVLGRSPRHVRIGSSVVAVHILQDAVERSLPCADYQMQPSSSGLVVEAVDTDSRLNPTACRTIAEQCSRSLRQVGVVAPVTVVRVDHARLLPSGKALRLVAAKEDVRPGPPPTHRLPAPVGSTGWCS